MDILTLSLAKAHLRIESDDHLEDEIITFQCEAAEAAVLDYIERDIVECYNEFSVMQMNSLKMACLMILEDLYNNRGARDMNGNYQINGVVMTFLKPLSKLA